MFKLTKLVFVFIVLFLGFQNSFAGTIPYNKDGEPTLAPMLEKVIPAVVNIAVSKKYSRQNNPLMDDPFFKFFFPERQQMPQEEYETQSIGSGVIIDSEKGYIVTNHHVIENADEIFITLKDGRKFKAEKLGSDPETDIALLQVKEKDLVSIPFANVEKIRVGDFVIAIGNPFGLGQTVTSGIVSAVERSGLGIEGYENFIQTDASINPGNSGGALINLKGELVGINTAIVAPQKGNVGIGFAIPVDMVEGVLSQLIKKGKVERGKIGIYMQDLTPAIADALELPKDTTGVLIANVVKGSPADLVGLKPYDVIVGFNGKKIKNSANLRNFIGITQLGETINLEVIRDKQAKSFSIKIAAEEDISNLSDSGEAIKYKGAVFSDIEKDNPFYGRIKGVFVANIERNSESYSSGLKQGDIVVSVNRMYLENLEDFKKILQAKPNALLLNVRRNNASIFILL